ncbi:MAG: hypothetical protein M3N95_12300 [Actinomycetota bacterium]|nr:hypothetical protein [Actinomycetota bacterium]
MNDEPAIATLRRAMNAQTNGHRLDPGLASTAWKDAHATRPRRIRTGLAVAASVIAVAGGAAALTLTLGTDTTTPPAGSSACTGNISTATLPTWARAGFSPDGLHTPHVLGSNGQIVGILFGELRAHQPEGTNNKILWVAKNGDGTLHISAQLEGSDTAATRTVNLGPSILDLPAAGCWQMTLTWPGHSDTIAITYQ